MLFGGLWSTIVAILVFIYGLSLGVRVGEKDCAPLSAEVRARASSPKVWVREAAPATEPCEEEEAVHAVGPQRCGRREARPAGAHDDGIEGAAVYDIRRVSVLAT